MEHDHEVMLLYYSAACSVKLSTLHETVETDDALSAALLSDPPVNQ